MKRIFVFLILFLPGILSGQESRPNPAPLPSGPLLKRAPEFSRWVVLYNPPPLGKKEEHHPIGGQLSVTKTRGIYRQEFVNAAGVRLESWRVGPLQIVRQANSGGLRVFDASSFGAEGADPLLYTDYSKADFPELEWIGAGNYVDIKKFMGVDCMIFRTPFDKENRPERIAYVAVETRLPVYFQSGEEISVYRFSPAPEVMQTLPAEVQAILEKRAKNIENMTRRPPRPF